MTVLHFFEGVYAAHHLRGGDWDHLHAHFIERAAVVALVASRLLDIPYSLTAHASDIYVNPVLLKEKLAGAKFVATCTGYNREYLSQFGEGLFNHKLNCIYHGLELSRYHRLASPPPEKPVVLAVGQLKERKGFRYLIQACRLLADRGCLLECHIVGEGPLREELEEQIRQLSLQGIVILYGSLPHQEVIEQYQQAAAFVLPAVIGGDGDRDGIPNVILEAMAMELPVVSTLHSGIPEVVQDGVNGLLVPPADEAALADAIAKLLDSPELRFRLGRSGRQMVTEKFDVERNVMRLLGEFAA
jgi:glycosyltransferase involved in cell wall biosynthesis